MSYEIRADYSKRWLFPPALEDFVPSDHPARLVRHLVDETIDMQEVGFPIRVSYDGRPSYACDLLLKVWLYGYMSGIRTSRKLEKATREHLSLVWLTGMNYPDHNTLWRFLRDNRNAIRAAYKLMLKSAIDQGLVGMVLHAVDGTKIGAWASREGMRTKEKLAVVLENVDSAVEEVLAAMEKADGDDEDRGYTLPADWQDNALTRAQVRELLDRMEAEERNKIHPLEPDARMVKTRSEGVRPGYNGQAVVDSKSGMIVAHDLVCDQNDFQQLAHMMDEVVETIGQCAEQTVADGGYASARELARCEERGVEVVVNEKLPDDATAKGKYHASRFRYDEEQDRLICPEGKELRFSRIQPKGKYGKVVRLYRGLECASCPARPQCTKDKRGRSVGLDPNHAALQRQRLKRSKPEFAELLKRRKEIIEAPFGFIKEVIGLRRFTMRGQEGASLQWTLACTAFNILKLLPKWRAGEFQLAT